MLVSGCTNTYDKTGLTTCTVCTTTQQAPHIDKLEILMSVGKRSYMYFFPQGVCMIKMTPYMINILCTPIKAKCDKKISSLKGRGQFNTKTYIYIYMHITFFKRLRGKDFGGKLEQPATITWWSFNEFVV